MASQKGLLANGNIWGDYFLDSNIDLDWPFDTNYSSYNNLYKYSIILIYHCNTKREDNLGLVGIICNMYGPIAK